MGILNWVGFWMMVTRRSSSSELSSPALQWHYNLHLRRLHQSCSPLVEVNIGLLADNVGVTTTNTLDLGQGVHDLALSIDVGVEETQDVLQVTNEFLAAGTSYWEGHTWNCWWASGTTSDMVAGRVGEPGRVKGPISATAPAQPHPKLGHGIHPFPCPNRCPYCLQPLL